MLSAYSQGCSLRTQRAAERVSGTLSAALMPPILRRAGERALELREIRAAGEPPLRAQLVGVRAVVARVPARQHGGVGRRVRRLVEGPERIGGLGRELRR